MKVQVMRVLAGQGDKMILACVCLLLLAATPALAAPESEQESLARSIERELMAPCCWTQTVADHDSEAADQMQSEIRTLLAQGMEKDQIIDRYVDRYGESILASPRARGFNLLAYALPFGAIVLAGTAISVWLFKRRQAAAVAERGRGGRSRVPGMHSRDQLDSGLRNRMEQELSRFD